MWRDPMDELIEQLEAALPAARGFKLDEPPLIEFQESVVLLLYGSAKERARLATDPHFAGLRAYFGNKFGATFEASELEKFGEDILIDLKDEPDNRR